ncbi:MAG TPA: YncE family protein [Candidatus Angelobacter sp.]|jgi:YVTN family beta-propeller protein|nr:YncE family protein [Candidatus Angelobacter sp.]
MFGLAAKLRQVALIDLPGSPGFSQVTMANGQVVITRPGTNTIEIFSPVKRRVIARISQISDPRGIAVDNESRYMYVALAGNSSIAVIDTRNWKVEKVVPVQHRPEKLLWVPQTKTLYATSVVERSLSTIDLRLGAESAVLELNAIPQDMVYDGSRQMLLLSLQDVGQIAAIDHSNKIVGRFKVVASEPTGLALDQQRRRLYVAVRYAVLALNADTGAELSRIPAPGGTDALVLDADSNLLYAAAGDGSVLAINLNNNTVDHELPTDVKGYSIAYDPAHKMLFLPGGREGRSKMVILSPSGVEPNRLQNAASPIESSPQTAAPQTAKR